MISNEQLRAVGKISYSLFQVHQEIDAISNLSAY